jgi:hypothetical protein
MGLLVELEHGTRDPETNVTDDDLSLSGDRRVIEQNEYHTYRLGGNK